MTDTTPSHTPMDTACTLLTAICSSDGPAMAALMADNFTWCMFPVSLGVPSKNRHEYLLQTAELGRIYTSLKLKTSPPLDMVQSGNTVVMHAAGCSIDAGRQQVGDG
ncbi:hypothetical protein DFH07DRAFT_950691 [Mycena maculata]|uniref:Uncharacterized protein n=1 Tax=Mycena maculata TaxID=230809 RepID=A0AAD7K585_9AGAR|nr:hypothetical protein DFH07DRAFT_950691 [Mycena maculata]